MMRYLFFFIVLMLLAQVAIFSQTDSMQRQINEQVWKPFIESFNKGDDETFSGVHSKEIIRVMQDDKQIIGFDQYFKKIPDSVKGKWASWKKNIELRLFSVLLATIRLLKLVIIKPPALIQKQVK